MSKAMHQPTQEEIQHFFDSITDRYDFVNSILSFGLDQWWRSQAVRELLSTQPQCILDVGTGTGRVVEEILRQSSRVQVIGLDLAETALTYAAQKLQGPSVHWVGGDALNLPFEAGIFDGVITAFTLRSVQNLGQFFSEVRRVMKRRGRLVTLELTRPVHSFVQKCHEWYLRLHVPVVAQFLSPYPDAYRFLSESVLQFAEPPRIVEHLEQAGFGHVFARSLSSGIVTLIGGERK